jgi:asparagine synthase (glutamine-hydrolysing)
MSGIAAIFQRNGCPVDRLQLRTMLARLAHRGPDAQADWADGIIGLGHVLLQTTPESQYESQPLPSRCGRYAISADARIDNRDELLSTLQLSDRPHHQISDCELILAAYQCWGTACPAHLLGDFAFVIWDARQQRLFCARDPFGMRPLLYSCHADCCVVGSESAALLALRRYAVNEAMVAEYLTTTITSLQETLYQGIERVPPAHSLSVTCEGMQIQCYWQIDCEQHLIYRDSAEYADHARQLLRQAVYCRVRSQHPIGVQVSGGLDSSSVAALAADMLKSGQITIPIHYYSMRFPGIEAADEGTYIADLATHWRFDPHISEPQPQAAACFLPQIAAYRDIPDYPSSAMQVGLMQQARSHGVRVILSGTGGDEWFAGSLYFYATLLRQAQFGTIWRELQHATRAWGIGGALYRMFSYGIVPLIPPGWRQVLRRVLRRPDLPSWIDAVFAKRIGLAERMQPKSTMPGDDAFQQMIATLYDGGQIHGLELQDRFAQRYGIEERHPLYDRRIVEFALSIPNQQHRQAAVHKRVLRQAMQQYLPTRIAQRRDKAHFSHLFAETLLPLVKQGFFQRLVSAECGWLNQQQVILLTTQLLHNYQRGDIRYAYQIWPLWSIFGIEHWLRYEHGVSPST